jgi:hypothetical protein
MKKVFFVCVLVAGLGVGCGEDTGETGGSAGNGGTGGSPVIGPLTWTVSNYTVVSDDCESASPTIPLTSFEITIDGDMATLESDDLMVPATGNPLGGVSMPYSPEDDPVIFTASYEDGVVTAPDCVVGAMDTFTVVLDDPTVSLDQNEIVDVTWDHAEIDDSETTGACDPPIWFVDLPCDSRSTFTLTQQFE